MRDIVIVCLVVSYVYDERDVMSVSYMYVWMNCTIGNKPAILLLPVNDLFALATHDLKAHNRRLIPFPPLHTHQS